jgi:hypothetical protein
MAYCTITDVRGLNPKRTYSTTTTPTQAQVEQYITDIAAEIDNAIQSQGYTVPVTSPANFVAVLKMLNARGAAAQAEIAMFPESGPGSTPHGAQLLSLYRDGLKALRSGEIPEEITGQTGANVASYYTESADKDSYDGPVFKKSSEF